MPNYNKTPEQIGQMSVYELKNYYQGKKNQYKAMGKIGVFDKFYETHKRHICTQCKGHVPYKIATQQIENKRENAPICVSCILKKKKPLTGIFSCWANHAS